MDLKNRTIIITGASSGIGAATAKSFGRAGARLVLGARRTEKLKEIASQIRQEGGVAVVLPGDVEDEGYAEALVKLAENEFGGLDGAFNNAGMVGDMVPVTEMSLANWHKTLATNLTSAFLAAKAQIPAMMHRGKGSIVFTSSFVGYSNGGLPGMSAYAASKAGLIGLVKSLASDHAASAIRVNALLPGGTITPMGGEGDAETMAFVEKLHPVGRMAAASEIAEAALFLLSDRASFVTGSAMLVDGGISARLI